MRRLRPLRPDAAAEIRIGLQHLVPDRPAQQRAFVRRGIGRNRHLGRRAVFEAGRLADGFAV